MAGLKSIFSKKNTDQAALWFLIVGLGNPGRQYRNTRHNVGFLLLDKLASEFDTQFTRLEVKALVGKVIHKNQHIVLAKPQTYMNLSGQSVAGLVNYYKVTFPKLIIAYDDVDLPFGTLRMRPAGGSGGHKGMDSIVEKVGTEDIPRLRLGIGRPPGRMDAADYVLQDFNKNEIEGLQFMLDRATEAIMTFISDGIHVAMNKYNSPESV